MLRLNDHLLQLNQKDVVRPIRTSAMFMISTSIEGENNCFKGQIVKLYRSKILDMADH